MKNTFTDYMSLTLLPDISNIRKNVVIYGVKFGIFGKCNSL